MEPQLLPRPLARSLAPPARVLEPSNIHQAKEAVAYDAMVVTVSPSISLSLTPLGAAAQLTWSGGSPPYTLQQSAALAPLAWSNLLTTSNQTATIPFTNLASFFRVQGISP